MKYTELKKAIKKARYVFGYVCVQDADGGYIQLVKKNLLLVISCPTMINHEFQAETRDGPDLYIN